MEDKILSNKFKRNEIGGKKKRKRKKNLIIFKPVRKYSMVIGTNFKNL